MTGGWTPAATVLRCEAANDKLSERQAVCGHGLPGCRNSGSAVPSFAGNLLESKDVFG
jgi:hypothetical protein